MKKFVMLLLCVFMVCGLCACGNGNLENTEDGGFSVKIINASDEEIYGIGYAYYVDGDVISSGGGCNADNSAIKVGDVFTLEQIPYTESFELELSVVDKEGKEYECASRILLDAEASSVCEIEVIGDFETGFEILRR